jgi:hypothetical protein
MAQTETKVDLEGYLEKKRPGAVNIYQKRYFVLSIANNTLSYYKDKETRDKAPEDMLGYIHWKMTRILSYCCFKRDYSIDKLRYNHVRIEKSQVRTIFNVSSSHHVLLRFDIQVKDESEAQSDSRCFSLRYI